MPSLLQSTHTHTYLAALTRLSTVIVHALTEERSAFTPKTKKMEMKKKMQHKLLLLLLMRQRAFLGALALFS